MPPMHPLATAMLHECVFIAVHIPIPVSNVVHVISIPVEYSNQILVISLKSHFIICKSREGSNRQQHARIAQYITLTSITQHDGLGNTVYCTV